MDPNAPEPRAAVPSPTRDPQERRRRSLERYRPGSRPHPPGPTPPDAIANARTDDDERFGYRRLPAEPGQREGDDRNRNSRSSRTPAPADAVAEADLGRMMGEMRVVGEGDLRHRLNQRSRNFQPPSGSNENRVPDESGRENHGHVNRENHSDRQNQGYSDRQNQGHSNRENQGYSGRDNQGHNRENQGYSGRDNQGHSGRDNHRRVQGRGVGNTVGNSNAAAARRPKRNTENFNPSHAPPDMRLLVAYPGLKKFDQRLTSRDVVIVSDLFCAPADLSIYEKLLKELEAAAASGVGGEGGGMDRLFQSWHGDSHQIADDKKRWKQDCPTFGWVVERMGDYFDMDVKATRLNLYRDSNEWKPFHHDAAAVKPDKARTQNFTVAVSFGARREAAFEHARTKTVLALPQPNGTIYTFGKDVNVEWRHGILQTPPQEYSDQGRLSIIAWGWIDQKDESL